MSAHVMTVEGSPADPGTPAPAGSRALREVLLYLFLMALVGGAWAFTRLGLYDSKSDIAYWLGVAGGVSMLLLFSYPMRKYLRFMSRLGESKYWFVAHMVLGIAGPLLILLHSRFQIGSLNAGVAFYSMVTVALSGVIGRFLYLQVHRGVTGKKYDLDSARTRLDADNTVAVRMRIAPGVMDRCRGFERWALERRVVTGVEIVRAMALTPWVRWRTSRLCHAELRRRFVKVAHTERWSRKQFNLRVALAQALVDDYLFTAQRLATFAAWERLFSWWHVAHLPFVYILVISAIAHIIAVHAY
jgi:hypothetical protein